MVFNSLQVKGGMREVMTDWKPKVVCLYYMYETFIALFILKYWDVQRFRLYTARSVYPLLCLNIHFNMKPKIYILSWGAINLRETDNFVLLQLILIVFE